MGDRLRRPPVGGQITQRARRLGDLPRVPGGIGVLDVPVPGEGPRIDQRDDPVPDRGEVGASGGGPQLQAPAQLPVLGDPLPHQRRELVPSQRRKPRFEARGPCPCHGPLTRDRLGPPQHGQPHRHTVLAEVALLPANGEGGGKAGPQCHVRNEMTERPPPHHSGGHGRDQWTPSGLVL